MSILMMHEKGMNSTHKPKGQTELSSQNLSQNVQNMKDLDLSQSLADFRNEIRNSVIDKLSTFSKAQIEPKNVESRGYFQNTSAFSIQQQSSRQLPQQQSLKKYSSIINEISDQKSFLGTSMANKGAQSTRKFKSLLMENDKPTFNHSPSKLSAQRGIDRIGKNCHQSSTFIIDQFRKNDIKDTMSPQSRLSPSKRGSPLKKPTISAITKNLVKAEISTINQKRTGSLNKRNSEPFVFENMMEWKKNQKSFSPQKFGKNKLSFEDIFNKTSTFSQKKLYSFEPTSPYQSITGSFQKFQDKLPLNQIQNMQKMLEQASYQDIKLLPKMYIQELTNLASSIATVLKKTSFYSDRLQ